MLHLLEQAVGCFSNASKVKEVTPMFTWLRDLPFQIRARKLLEFTCSSNDIQLSYLCYEANGTLIVLCRCLAVAFEPGLQEWIDLDVLDANITMNYMNVTQKLKEGLILITVARFYMINCSPDTLTRALRDIQTNHLSTIAKQRALYIPADLSQPKHLRPAAQPRAPDIPADLSQPKHLSPAAQPRAPDIPADFSNAASTACKNLARDIKQFLSKTGFRNIKFSEGKNAEGVLTHYILVIAQVDDEEMPVPSRTFPIRFEINFEFKLRLFVSKDRSVAAFLKEYRETTINLAQELTNLLQPNYVYVCETKNPQSRSERSGISSENGLLQLHLVRTLPLDYFSQNCEQRLNEVYLDGIQTIKWTVSAPYTHLIAPRESVQFCLAKITHRNPANPTNLPTFFSLLRKLYLSLSFYLRQENLTHFLSMRYPSQEGEIVDIQQCMPLDYISVSEVMRDNPSDAVHFLAEIKSLSSKARREAGIPLSLDIFAIHKQTRKPAVLLSSSGLPDSMETCHISDYFKAQQLFTPLSRLHDPLHLWLSGDNVRLLIRHSQSIFVGEHCGRRVRLLFCPEEVLQDPQLPAYLMETRKIEDVGEILGLIELEGSTYIVHPYPQSSKLTLHSVKELARKMNKQHVLNIYHCFISLETISITESGVFFYFPCIRPSFFPLVSRLLSPERLNYQLDPNLTPLLIYGIEPQAAELEAADSFAVSLLIQQHCLSEVPQLKMGKGLLSFLQSGPSWNRILEALEIESPFDES